MTPQNPDFTQFIGDMTSQVKLQANASLKLAPSFYKKLHLKPVGKEGGALSDPPALFTLFIELCNLQDDHDERLNEVEQIFSSNTTFFKIIYDWLISNLTRAEDVEDFFVLIEIIHIIPQSCYLLRILKDFIKLNDICVASSSECLTLEQCESIKESFSKIAHTMEKLQDEKDEPNFIKIEVISCALLNVIAVLEENANRIVDRHHQLQDEKKRAKTWFGSLKILAGTIIYMLTSDAIGSEKTLANTVNICAKGLGVSIGVIGIAELKGKQEDKSIELSPGHLEKELKSYDKEREYFLTEIKTGRKTVRCLKNLTTPDFSKYLIKQ